MSEEDALSSPAEAQTEAQLQQQQQLDYDSWNGLDIIESLCINCREQGTTIIKLHKIPFFKELVIASFSCPHCRYTNNEVSFGGEIQVKGSVCELTVTTAKDLNRQLIKSDSATVRIPQLEFEIPPKTQKGEITTIEGILQGAVRNLSMYQRERLQQDPEVGLKVADVITRLRLMAEGDGDFLPFTIVVDDPSGNSYIENPSAPLPDPHMTTSTYVRSQEQDTSLGLDPASSQLAFRDDKDTNFGALALGAFGKDKEASKEEEEGERGGGAGGEGEKDTPYPTIQDDDILRLGRSEVMSIPSPCPNCSKLGESMTAVTCIPHFKEVIIMGFNCEFCGFRNNEVKGGGAIPPLGTTVTLKVRSVDDLKRDVLKSDSAMVTIPELDLELGHGTLGGVYTTVEGLMNKIYTNLRDNNPFAVGDSATQHHSVELSVNPRFLLFLDNLQSFAKGEHLPFTLEIRDPLGNSFISAPLGSFLPPESDANLTMQDFERSFDENEEFGLNDMNTRDFETGADYDTVILPDRLTHVTAKGQDHPTPFATGTVDSTPGGRFFGGDSGGSGSLPQAMPGAQEDEGEGSYFLTPPEGYSVAKAASSAIDAGEAPTWSLPPDYGTRRFADDSRFADRFDPREEFACRRPGFVYRLGSLGLGYYPDEKSVI